MEHVVGCTGCDEYAHAHFIAALTENIAYLGKPVTFSLIPVKRLVPGNCHPSVPAPEPGVSTQRAQPEAALYRHTHRGSLGNSQNEDAPTEKPYISGKWCMTLCVVVLFSGTALP